jgi:hypothetical protein
VENVTDRSLRFTKVIRFYPEWPTFIAKDRDVVWTGSQFRFGLLTDPLENDGFISGYVTVSGFQGSSRGGFPAFPAVLSAALRQTVLGGEEIHYALPVWVSTPIRDFFQPLFSGAISIGLGAQKRPPDLREARATRPSLL